MSKHIKKLNIINQAKYELIKHIDLISERCIKKDKEIFEDVLKEDIKLPIKRGKGRPKKIKKD
jgi:hypothetical protein